MTPFDTLASSYAKLWTETPRGVSQRTQVWRELDAALPSGARILDLGCGAGDDAVYLASRGMDVTGIDASREMIAVARRRGVHCRQLAIEDLHEVAGPFDAVLSNFGALNCISDPAPVVAQLERLIQPGGTFALCVMPRFSWTEFVSFARKGDFPRAVRRWRGLAHWRGIAVRYWTRRQWRAILAPHFTLLRSVNIGGDDHIFLLFGRTRK